MPVAVVQSGSDGQNDVDPLDDATVPPTPTAPSDAELFYTQARALDKKKDANKSDINQAMALYRKSVDLGNTLAMVALADLLRREDSKQHNHSSVGFHVLLLLWPSPFCRLHWWTASLETSASVQRLQSAARDP